MISVLEIKNKKITHNRLLFMGVKKIDKNTYLSLIIFFFLKKSLIIFFFFVLFLFVILISKFYMLSTMILPFAVHSVNNLLLNPFKMTQFCLLLFLIKIKTKDLFFKEIHSSLSMPFKQIQSKMVQAF